MSAPRAERRYRVTRGRLVGIAPTVSQVAKRFNHEARHKLRVASQRVDKHSSNRRGVAKPQGVPPYSVSGPSAKSLDRLQDLAQTWYADNLITLEAA